MSKQGMLKRFIFGYKCPVCNRHNGIESFTEFQCCHTDCKNYDKVIKKKKW
jgi:Zn ribbon nucleic-acid-binding protein